MGYQTHHMKMGELLTARRLIAEGASHADVCAALGRSQEKVSRHTGNLLSMRARSLRLERLFASCNRVLAEVRT